VTSQIFIVAAARSGAGLFHSLFLLDKNFHSGALSEDEKIASLLEKNLAKNNYEMKDQKAGKLTAAQVAKLQSEYKGKLSQTKDVIVDYNPRLASHVTQLADTFAQAKFIFVTRSPAQTIWSSRRAWESKKFVSHPDLPEWWGEPWAFNLIPNWRELIGQPMLNIVASQWAFSIDSIFKSSESIDSSRWINTSFETLMINPLQEMKRITKELDVEWNGKIPPILPTSKNALLLPGGRQPRVAMGQIGQVLEPHKEIVIKYNAFRAPFSPKKVNNPAAGAPRQGQRKTMKSEGTNFAYTASKSFANLLESSNSSVVISTYNSGQVIFVRASNGGLDAEFKSYSAPMGIAVSANKLAVGVKNAVLTYSNQPPLSQFVEPAGKSDKVFAPRTTVFTGQIDIHEMEFGQGKDADDLWFLNTSFSCLCKLDMNYSFQPVWKPSWITDLAPEDRCHLNGMAMVNSIPKYVSALSQTNTKFGWREKKGVAGVIIDTVTNKVICKGLSMPHSPRWHNKKLWILESGKGSLATVSIETGEVTTIVTLPGFTRGLNFIGPYALVGLSQVRESVFKDLPITSKKDERNCGVWIIDTRNGEIVGELKFSGIVKEIFDVKVLPNTKWPTILDDPGLTQSHFVLSSSHAKQKPK
jgi:uncharacterized protein (TIGR03032 family)